MTTQLTYSEFKTRRINFEKSQPTYLQGLEDNFEEMTKHIYNNYYLKGRVPSYAKI